VQVPLGLKKYYRITMIILLYSSNLGYETLFLLPLHSGIGIYGGLYQVSSLTQTFLIFISILSIIILQLSSFYYRHLEHKGNIFDQASDSNEHSYFILKREIKQADNIYGNKNYNKIFDLLEEEIKIIEYPLVIFFISNLFFYGFLLIVLRQKLLINCYA
jgi:hypothetical protein